MSNPVSHSLPGIDRVCTFHLGDRLYGMDVAIVREVLAAPRVTPVPLAPPSVIGVMNLRGRIVTAIDLRRRLDLPANPAGEAKGVSVVVETGGELVSFLVDRAGDVLEVADLPFELAPETLSGAARDLLVGAYKLSSGLVLLLDGMKAAVPEAGPRPHAKDPA